MQHAEGTALEPHDPDRDVLGLDPLVGEGAGVGEHLDRPAHRGDQQVDGVHALVHQRAAAVELPGAPPVAGVVVALSAPPVDRGDAAGQPAELAGRDGVDGDLGGRIEPVLGDDRDQRAGLRWAAMISSVFSTVTSAGFSMMTCLPASQGLDGDGAVQPGRGADRTTSISSRPGRPPGGERPAAVFGGQPLRPLGMMVDDRDQLDLVGQLADHLGRGYCRSRLRRRGRRAPAGRFWLRRRSCVRNSFPLEDVGKGPQGTGEQLRSGQRAELSLLAQMRLQGLLVLMQQDHIRRFGGGAAPHADCALPGLSSEPDARAEQGYVPELTSPASLRSDGLAARRKPIPKVSDPGGVARRTDKRIEQATSRPPRRRRTRSAPPPTTNTHHHTKGVRMKYLMLVADDPEADPNDTGKGALDIDTWVSSNQAAGRWMTGNRLRPAEDATTVRCSSPKRPNAVRSFSSAGSGCG